ncbi:MAG TPA: hypothetical protein VN255_13365 [Mycobacterium sp.]|nr:hypothetical protein [Mycobacterium sp.]
MSSETLQLFYVGTDAGVWSRWRNPDGSWSDEQALGGVVGLGDIAASVVPGTEILQLFYQGSGRGCTPVGATRTAHGRRSRASAATWDLDITAIVVPGTEILQRPARSSACEASPVSRGRRGKIVENTTYSPDAPR